jgi:hypothetical protein
LKFSLLRFCVECKDTSPFSKWTFAARRIVAFDGVVEIL